MRESQEFDLHKRTVEAVAEVPKGEVEAKTQVASVSHCRAILFAGVGD